MQRVHTYTPGLRGDIRVDKIEKGDEFFERWLNVLQASNRPEEIRARKTLRFDDAENRVVTGLDDFLVDPFDGDDYHEVLAMSQIRNNYPGREDLEFVGGILLHRGREYAFLEQVNIDQRYRRIFDVQGLVKALDHYLGPGILVGVESARLVDTANRNERLVRAKRLEQLGKAGFQLTDVSHQQPPYRQGEKPLEYHLLVRQTGQNQQPRTLGQKVYLGFSEWILRKVYGVMDPDNVYMARLEQELDRNPFVRLTPVGSTPSKP